MIFYSATVPVEPLWIPILWNTLFIATNIVQILITKWRARAVTLDPLETFLSKTALHNFPHAEVKSFAAIAKDGDIPAGKQLIQADTDLDYLFCLLKGKVDIINRGEKCAELGPGSFVGEMSLLTKAKTRADVVATSDLRLLAWPHDAIEKWIASDATRLTLLQQALGTQVVDQLLRQNEELLNNVRNRDGV